MSDVLECNKVILITLVNELNILQKLSHKYIVEVKSLYNWKQDILYNLDKC